MTNRVIIFDIDGTLADLRHRLHFIQNGKKDYDGFFDAMGDDTPIEPVVWLARKLGTSFGVICVSGRPDSHREQTSKWLKAHGLDIFNVVDIYMRKAGDYRPDHIVKREILDQIRADGYDPFLVIDDRPQVVEMWRSQGLVCLQNAWHEDGFDHAAYQGETLLTLMVGPSGAGKSNWVTATLPNAAAQLKAAQAFDFEIHSSHILSSDQLRHDLCGDFRIQDKNDQVFAALHDLARTRLKHGLPTVIDATHLNKDDRLAAVGLAPKGTRVRYVVVDRPLESKQRTAGWRAAVSVKGMPLVEYHHNKFIEQAPDILAGDGLDHIDIVDLRV